MDSREGDCNLSASTPFLKPAESPHPIDEFVLENDQQPALTPEVEEKKSIMDCMNGEESPMQEEEQEESMKRSFREFCFGCEQNVSKITQILSYTHKNPRKIVSK